MFPIKCIRFHTKDEPEVLRVQAQQDYEQLYQFCSKFRRKLAMQMQEALELRDEETMGQLYSKAMFFYFSFSYPGDISFVVFFCFVHGALEDLNEKRKLLLTANPNQENEQFSNLVEDFLNQELTVVSCNEKIRLVGNDYTFIRDVEPFAENITTNIELKNLIDLFCPQIELDTWEDIYQVLKISTILTKEEYVPCESVKANLQVTGILVSA